MTKVDLFSDVPHYEVIRENGTVQIPSVFMFKGGCDELFPFLAACESLNCTVIFENEKIKVTPKGDNAFQNVTLSFYAFIAEQPKMVNDYLRYLQNIEKMNWVNGVHEAIS